jgi:hypothetical protein
MASIQDESGTNILDESGSIIYDEAGGAAGDVTVDVGLQTLSLGIKSVFFEEEDQASSWLQTQLQQYNYEPSFRVYVGASDYAERVVKYPTIRASGQKLKSVKINIPLANDDGALNNFFESTYLLVNSVQIQIGDTHPTSGWDGLTLFNGFVHGVSYNKNQCVVEARDRLWDFSQMKVGDTDSIVEMPSSGGIIPSDIAWTLCTCYGGLDTTEGGGNTDIHWDDFRYWAEQFSSNNVVAHGRFDGMKITEALDELGRYTDSVISIGRDGKLHFAKFEEVNSLDYTWTHDEMLELKADVNKRRLVNRQWVYWDYDPSSEYYTGKVLAQDSLSVNTFGLYEQVEESDNIWWVDSVSAISIAQRRITLYSQPPKLFRLTTGLDGIWREIGETARFVDDFFSVTSGAGWRIVEQELHLGQAKMINYLDEATVLNGFYLDVDYLDGDKYLL